MSNPSLALVAIPSGLRDPLLEEYRAILQNYMERRWLPSELSGGRICEIVYTILDGYAQGGYAAAPAKPANFPAACRALESHNNVPRSFQILIPRLLPALYEIRNNRGVGHVGGDVDPNHMDTSAVVSIVNWIMAELVRVYHSLSIDEAQYVVDSLAERRIPLIWTGGDVKRLLVTSLKLKDQVLLLMLSAVGKHQVKDLQRWTEYRDEKYFRRTLKGLHSDRFIELSDSSNEAQLLPPGTKYVEELLQKITLK